VGRPPQQNWPIGSEDNPLAAAYAEVGDFDAAIKWEEKALGLFASETDRLMARFRLMLYKAHRFYR
jgi:hypothetical protein